MPGTKGVTRHEKKNTAQARAVAFFIHNILLLAESLCRESLKESL